MYIPVALPQQLSITHVVTAFDESAAQGRLFFGGKCTISGKWRM